MKLDAITYLRSIYTDPVMPLTTRMRAAMACLPFEVPKLAVTAQVTENDIATLLDRRIAHLQLIEAQPAQPDKASSVELTKAPTPSINFRSLRRWI